MAEQGWVEAVQVAFGGLTAPHVEKKKATIIALVDARLAGRADESIWHLPGVCNRGTYHLKWKKDPTFAQALEAVDRLAREWKDSRAVRALQEAAERLALAAPIAAGRAMALLASSDEGIVLRAAFGILDRAGVETATKAAPVGVQVIEVVKDYGDGGAGGAGKRPDAAESTSGSDAGVG